MATTHETISADKWFSEGEVMWPGQKLCLKVKNIVHQEKSEFQDILVFDSETYGRVLVLDSVVQLTERDEFAYQEMIAHIPLFAHPDPKRVLIVGGGDGGVLREVAKHKGVTEIVQCEIDQRVVQVSKQYFPDTMATAFDDPRLHLHFMDAAVYMEEHKGEFDVIIVDSSDPVGPAETLYTTEFYKHMYEALRPGGCVSTQGECVWLHLDLISRVISDAKGLFPVVDYAYTTIPTYPSGQIGFILCAKSDNQNFFRTADRAPSRLQAEGFRYYNQHIHQASFELPQFAEEKLQLTTDRRDDATTPPPAVFCGYKLGKWTVPSVAVAVGAAAFAAGYLSAMFMRRARS